MSKYIVDEIADIETRNTSIRTEQNEVHLLNTNITMKTGQMNNLRNVVIPRTTTRLESRRTDLKNCQNKQNDLQSKIDQAYSHIFFSNNLQGGGGWRWLCDISLET